MTVHIEGMGWLGSALALRLHAANIDFTWHDSDSHRVAWRACTGIVYPAGDARSQDNLAGWGDWIRQGLFDPQHVSEALYCYAHINPPHEGRYPVVDFGWLRAARAPCYAVNVPAIVTATRTRFAAQRRPSPPEGCRRVIAHGFGERHRQYMWGWSVPVALDLPAELTDAAGPHRLVALYARKHRFQIVYAYPQPGRPGWWWAGSSLVGQKTAGLGDANKAFSAWREAAQILYPKVAILDYSAPAQGWRPRGANDDPMDLRVWADGTVEFPPLWHSGVRWAPGLVEDATRHLTAAQVGGSG